MTDRELMQMALDAFELECRDLSGNKIDLVAPAIKALRDRLAQPEQECIYPECETGIGCDGPCGEKPVDETAKRGHEPVAWSVLNKRTGKHWYTHESRYTAQYYANEYSHRESDNTPSMVVTPLYTAPPKREWVGLTDEEIEDEWQSLMAKYIEEVDSSYWGRCDFEFARAIEAKLKEKNT